MPRQEVVQTRYSWRKANMGKFGKDLDNQLKAESNEGLSTTAKLDRLINAIQNAAKDLPKGCRKDPKAWWTEEIAEAEEERNLLREDADKGANEKKAWLDKCEEVRKLISEGKTKAFREFLEGLSDKSDSGYTYKVQKR